MLSDIARVVAVVEEALVAAARGAAPEPPGDVSPTRLAIAAGATSAIASRFLAVGTPRSIGLVGHGAVARAALAAHRVLFAPREIRIADDHEAQALADEVHGRVTTLEQACACDIVCVARAGVAPDGAPLVRRAWLRGGTHVNALIDDDGRAVTIDDAIRPDAMVVVEDRPSDLTTGVYGTLAEIAAGFKDGRQLDEITLFVAGSLAAARAAIARLADAR